MAEEMVQVTESMNPPEMHWYTLHVYSSMEKSAFNALKDRIERSEFKELFGELLLPTEKVEEIKPDIIVSDSVAFWGKLVAMKHGLPYVSSYCALGPFIGFSP